jgi:hypothetical protein
MGEPGFSPFNPLNNKQGVRGDSMSPVYQKIKIIKWEYFFHFIIFILINLSISLKTKDEKVK